MLILAIQDYLSYFLSSLLHITFLPRQSSLWTQDLSLALVTCRIRTLPSTPAFSLPILQIPPNMHLGDLKKGREKEEIAGRRREQSQETYWKIRAKSIIGRSGRGKKDGRAQDGPEPFRSGKKNQCNPRKDRNTFSSCPLVPISSPAMVPPLKCGTRSWGTHSQAKKTNPKNS